MKRKSFLFEEAFLRRGICLSCTLTLCAFELVVILKPRVVSMVEVDQSRNATNASTTASGCYTRQDVRISPRSMKFGGSSSNHNASRCARPHAHHAALVL